MEDFFDLLRQNINIVESICNKIENGETYIEDIRAYLPELNQMTVSILNIMQDPEISLEMDPAFMMQVLNDVLYGIENEDGVFLLDVLRYGLLEIYDYIGNELQNKS